MAPGYSISAVVPVYNEAETLPGAMATITGFLAAHFKDYEVVIVESGSRDGSDRVCDELARSEPRIRTIHEGARNGFGSALRMGYREASKDLVFLMTADLPFPLDAVLRAVPLLGDCDCVLSYRIDDHRSVWRRAQSVVFNRLTKSLLGLSVRHVNSAFKLFKRPVLQAMHLESNGWLIDTEIHFWLKRLQIRCVEIPVPLIERTAGKSTVGVATSLNVFRDLLRFWWRTRRQDPTAGPCAAGTKDLLPCRRDTGKTSGRAGA